MKADDDHGAGAAALGFSVLARIREAMEFRCFTVEELAGATEIQTALVRRRFVEPGRLHMYELEAIAKACQVPVLFLFDGP